MKLLKIMLANYTPEKWQQITGAPVPEGLTEDKVLDYDIVVKETQLTDTQKNLSYFQALEAMKIGINIPQQYLIEQMPIADKTRLKEMYMQEAQQAQQVQQKQEELQMMELQAKINLVDAQAQADRGLSAERQSRVYSNYSLSNEREMEAQKDLESATLDKIKSIKELQGIDLEHIRMALEIIEKLKMEAAQEVIPDQASAAPIAPQEPQEAPDVIST